jgi:non-structural maintenance of chromosomes element 4
MSSSPALSDSPDRSSNKENGRRSLTVREKDTPGPESSKRKRALNNRAEQTNLRRRTEEPSQEPNDGSSGSGSDEDSNMWDKYDPDQPIEERRELQRGLRKLREDARINRDKYIQPGEEGVRRLIEKANILVENVKQTTEATIDSRLLVETVELSYKKTSLLTSGDAGQGVDIDGFVTQCIQYMRLGAGIANDEAAELTSTQRQRRRPSNRAGPRDSDDEDAIGDSGDPCNWEHLGRFVCVPHVRRPAVSGFLLGPLSVEKKVRKIAKRSAPFRPSALKETRPEVLDASAIQRKEDNDLTVICNKIRQRIQAVQEEAQDAGEDAFNNGGEAEAEAVMKQYGLKRTGGLDFFRCVINPDSFGQTIENMFYVSFLIRDNKLQLELDDDGHPTLGKPSICTKPPEQS